MRQTKVVAFRFRGLRQASISTVLKFTTHQSGNAGSSAALAAVPCAPEASLGQSPQCLIQPDANGHVTIPSSVTSIGYQAFYGCSSLASVTIPSSVTSIGGNAFQSCSSLTSVTIPSSVTSIGGNAFQSCSSLASVAIPSSVTSIGACAFSDCSSLASVAIPSSVTSIGNYAFNDCTKLASVTIPSSVTSIGAYAFNACTKLASVTIPSSVTSIGQQAFASCSSLVSVTIPSSWTSIPDQYQGLETFPFSCTSAPALCLCAAGYGATLTSTTLTCFKCPGSTYSTVPNRSSCLTVAPTAAPTPRPSARPSANPSPKPTAPTTAPTPRPSASPSANPSPQPTAAPTPGPTQSQLSSLYAYTNSSNVVTDSNGLPTYSIQPTRFTHLGFEASKWYLSVAIYGTGWGINNPGATITLTTKQGPSVLNSYYRCDPGNHCIANSNNYGSDLPTLCVTNHEIDSSDLLESDFGSIQLDVTTSNVQSTICQYKGFSIYLEFTLSGSNPQPTRMPTTAPPSKTVVFAGLASSSASINQVITGTGALFYVIAAVAVLFAALALLLAQMKQNKPHLYELGLIESIVTMALIGSSFASEMFLMAALFSTPGCLVLGVVLVVGRLLHAPAAGYLLYGMFGPKSSSLPLASLLDQDLILQSSKVFGATAVLGSLDCTVLRLFPWLSSPFIRKAGYPTGRVFLVCVCTKLLQSVVTVSCQVSFFVLVNAAVTADTPQAQQSLAFLCINMATTVLLVVLNAFEFIMQRGILLTGTLSTAPNVVLPHPSSSSSSSYSLPQPRMSLNASVFTAPDSSCLPKDFIPEVEVDNPIRQSSSTRVSSSSSTLPPPHPVDVEIAGLSSSRLPVTSDAEEAGRLRALEEKNARMEEQNAQMQEQLAKVMTLLATKQ